MNTKHSKSLFVLVLLSLFTIFLFFFKIPGKNFVFIPKRNKDLTLVSKAIDTIRAFYVESISNQKLIDSAISGMVSSLDDHSCFIPPDSYEESEIEATGNFAGIGVEITMDKNEIMIVSPIADSPAELAQLKPYDKIIKINNIETKNMTLSEITKKLRGTPGSNINLTIKRNENSFNISLTRDIILINTIKKTTIFDDNIGYIKITKFQENTYKKLTETLDILLEKNIKKLIIDLRNNPGGLLDAAINIAELFLDEKTIIVKTKGKTPAQNETYISHKTSKYNNLDIAILINNGSASASEVFTGALKDANKAKIFGEKSFGKGSIQTVFPIALNTSLMITTGKYFTPKDQVIDKKGIMPDIIIKNSENFMDLCEYNPDSNNNKFLERNSSEIKDIQLKTAIDYLKNK